MQRSCRDDMSGGSLARVQSTVIHCRDRHGATHHCSWIQTIRKPTTLPTFGASIPSKSGQAHGETITTSRPQEFGDGSLDIAARVHKQSRRHCPRSLETAASTLPPVSTRALCATLRCCQCQSQCSALPYGTKQPNNHSKVLGGGFSQLVTDLGARWGRRCVLDIDIRNI